jgi:hypothetical protein
MDWWFPSQWNHKNPTRPCAAGWSRHGPLLHLRRKFTSFGKSEPALGSASVKNLLERSDNGCFSRDSADSHMFWGGSWGLITAARLHPCDNSHAPNTWHRMIRNRNKTVTSKNVDTIYII